MRNDGILGGRPNRYGSCGSRTDATLRVVRKKQRQGVVTKVDFEILSHDVTAAVPVGRESGATTYGPQKETEPGGELYVQEYFDPD